MQLSTGEGGSMFMSTDSTDIPKRVYGYFAGSRYTTGWSLKLIGCRQAQLRRPEAKSRKEEVIYQSPSSLWER
jgi:hypothetical protein